MLYLVIDVNDNNDDNDDNDNNDNNDDNDVSDGVFIYFRYEDSRVCQRHSTLPGSDDWISRDDEAGRIDDDSQDYSADSRESRESRGSWGSRGQRRPRGGRR